MKYTRYTKVFSNITEIIFGYDAFEKTDSMRDLSGEVNTSILYT
jgi:hypothetical protein